MREHELGVSMTPMVDVVFLLLIFFVCTASFQIAEAVLPSPFPRTTGSAVDPPQEAQPLERIVIAVEQENARTVLRVNEQPCESPRRLSELLGLLAEIDAELPIIMDIGSEAPLGSVIDVFDRARLAGFTKVQFAAEPGK
jgi:biopolymer transport protein ExbD